MERWPRLLHVVFHSSVLALYIMCPFALFWRDILCPSPPLNSRHCTSSERQLVLALRIIMRTKWVNICNALSIVPRTWEVYNKYYLLLLSQPKTSKFYVVTENIEPWLMFCNWSGGYLNAFDGPITHPIHLFFPSGKLRDPDLPPPYPHPFLTLLQQGAIMWMNTRGRHAIAVKNHTWNSDHKKT